MNLRHLPSLASFLIGLRQVLSLVQPTLTSAHPMVESHDGHGQFGWRMTLLSLG